MRESPIAPDTRQAIPRRRVCWIKGDSGAEVLVRDIEVACRELLLAHLDSGEDTVGTRIELDHMAATLLGMTASLTVTVTEVKGRAVSFAIEGSDGVDAICRGTHNRFVVDLAQTKSRLAAKAAKAGMA